MGRFLVTFLILALSVVLLAAGGITLIGEQTVRTVANSAEGRIPGTLRFDAEDGRYGVTLFVNATDFDVRNTRCTVRRADGSIENFRGNVQAISVSGANKSVGEFRALAGPTSVTCDGPGSVRSQRFAVGKIRTGARTVAFVLLGLGVLALLWFFWRLFRGSTRASRHREVGPSHIPTGNQ